MVYAGGDKQQRFKSYLSILAISIDELLSKKLHNDDFVALDERC